MQVLKMCLHLHIIYFRQQSLLSQMSDEALSTSLDRHDLHLKATSEPCLIDIICTDISRKT